MTPRGSEYGDSNRGDGSTKVEVVIINQSITMPTLTRRI